MKKEVWGKALIFMWLPLLCCMVSCAMEGRAIWDVYLPSSPWNDELFYFKQVEGILQYGFPQGFFGFNESHALELSFAAWSPVLVFPWLLFGLLFGWNLMTPVYCNIFLMMLAVFLFVLLLNPSVKQLLLTAILFATFSPMTRFMLSGMPEVICFAMVIVQVSLAISFTKEAKKWKCLTMFFMACVMTLMRPYLLVFLLFPAYQWIKGNKKVGIPATIAGLVVTGGAYASINYYLSAAYFTPLFDVAWITTFFQEGIWEGVKFTLYKLWSVGGTVTAMTIEAFRSGYHAGTQFAGFFLVTILLLWQGIVSFHKKKKAWAELYLILTICYVGMFVALLLMYKPIEGGRHLLTFIAAGIVLVSTMESQFLRKGIFTGALFGFLYIVMATNAYEHQIPYTQKTMVETLDYWQDTLADELVLSTESVPNYDNVIIWTLSDQVAGETVSLQWQELYAVPAGFGISCCQGAFVAENFEALQSKYLALPVGGELDQKCARENRKVVGKSEDVIIYELR